MGEVLSFDESGEIKEKRHCCEQMTERINYKCSQHPHVFDCPDNLVYYSPRFNEYGIIIHDGGSSYITIDYCCWCGVKLPESKRDEWFDRLQELGFGNPTEQDIPKEFLSCEWYEKT